MWTGRIEKAVQHSGKEQRRKTGGIEPANNDQKGLVGTHMKLQRLLSLTRQALDTYGLIQDGDRIAVGVSGGKDVYKRQVPEVLESRFFVTSEDNAHRMPEG